MLKLNQVVAIVKGLKEDANKRTAPIFQSTRRPELFAGVTQTYRPVEEGGARLPDDNTEVQLTVPEVLAAFARPMIRLFDVICTAEFANTEAFGDVVINRGTDDEQVLLEHMPVTFLMQFEKFLEREVRGLIRDLPTLDLAESWAPSTTGRVGTWETPEFQTHRTRKVPKPIVLYPATPEHPAQTNLIQEDVIDGYWHKRRFSGAVPAFVKDDLLMRCEQLIAAVKMAREQANDRPVTEMPVGATVFGFLFN